MSDLPVANRTAMITRGTTGLPATILLALLLEFLQHGKLSIPLDDLPFYTMREEDKVRDAVKTLGPDFLGYISIITRERKKFIALAEMLQMQLPGAEKRLPEYSESTLSSSSNYLSLKDQLTTTTTLSSDSEYSESAEKTADEAKNDFEQVRRILDATSILFGEPGVITSKLHLEGITPQVALGWVRQGWNAKNLEIHKRAGLVFNGIKSGELPKPAFLNGNDDALLLDYCVAIGRAEKACELCGQGFKTLEAYDKHFKNCVFEPKPEAPDEENEFNFEPNPAFDERRNGGEDMSINQIWGVVLAQLRADMPPASFQTWVQDSLPVAWDEDNKILKIAACNTYAKDWMENRLLSTVARMLAGMLNCAVDVQFVTEAA